MEERKTLDELIWEARSDVADARKHYCAAAVKYSAKTALVETAAVKNFQPLPIHDDMQKIKRKYESKSFVKPINGDLVDKHNSFQNRLDKYCESKKDVLSVIEKEKINIPGSMLGVNNGRADHSDIGNIYYQE